MDSKIIEIKLHEKYFDLIKMCNFPIDQKWELLYRGSESNFSWVDFHQKCDNISGTLVVVKTRDGGIFGGYTQAEWNESKERHNGN